MTERELTLVGVDGQTFRIPASEVRRHRTTDTSFMPEGLHEGLTEGEFADLVEYLVSLKRPDSALALHRGMPPSIAEAAAPVALRPLHGPDAAFDHPVWFGPVPGVGGSFAVAEHESGRVWRLEVDGERVTKQPFADTGRFMTGTRGLLGMAFHPRYPASRRYFYAKHLVVERDRFATVIFEGQAAADLRRDSGRPHATVLRIDGVTNVHYGGGLAFGPDGHLYIGTGDSGPQQDPRGNGQAMGLLLGKS